MARQWREREWILSNGVCELVRYPIPNQNNAITPQRKRCQAKSHTRKNAHDACLRLSRILNENFVVGKDFMITLTFSNGALERIYRRNHFPDEVIAKLLSNLPPEQRDGKWSDAVYDVISQEAERFARRCRYICRKKGIEYRYVYIVSDVNGKTLVPARPHIHCIVNEAAANVWAGCWNGSETEPIPKKLYGKMGRDLSPVAQYMIDQVRHTPGKARYHPSRSLHRPEPTKEHEVLSISDRLLIPPENCEIIWQSEFVAGCPQLLRYYCPS